MSRLPTSRSPDLQRLVDEGYDLALVDGTLLVSDIPFVNAARELRRGILATPLSMRGDRTAPPARHFALWIGGMPCDVAGEPLAHLVQMRSSQLIAPGIQADHVFCNKPKHREFRDYHELVTTYVALVGTHAAAIDPIASARRQRRAAAAMIDAAPFRYVDTATTRSGIAAAQDRIRGSSIGIVGAGGTGSYVLDLVAKTPVAAIHLFDADRFDQHNAFRSPGAASIQELAAEHLKVEHLARIYSRMHRGIVPHPCRIDALTAPLLDVLDFCFLCLDDAAAKPTIIERLAARKIPFVDAGMGLTITEGGIIGAVRTTLSAFDGHEHAAEHIPMIGDPDGIYASNVQVADLNALNAAFAVIAWKRHAGFYATSRVHAHGVFVVEDGMLHVEDEG